MAPENFKENKQESSDDKERVGFTRREFLKTLGLATGGVLCSGLEKAIAQEAPSRYEKHGWSYTLEEMREIYEQEYDGEKILKNFLRKKNGNWVGLIGGKEFAVPQEFLDKTLKHLKDMLEQEAAKFIFRLDCSHGHFFIDKEIYKSKYAALDGYETARALVGDSGLGILFHNLEHLKADSEEAVECHKKRNVAGWYDGRPIAILPLPKDKKSTAVSAEELGHDLAPYPKFAAHKEGSFSIEVGGKEIRLDISFDDNSYY